MRIDPKIKQDLKNKLKEELADKKNRVVVVSAYKLSETEINSLNDAFPQLLQSKTEYLVDENLIAGYIIKIGSQVTDLSLKGQLQNFKNKIYEID